MNQPPPAQSSARVKSNRMYAIILGLVALVGLAVVMAIQMSPEESTPSYTPPEASVSTPASVPEAVTLSNERRALGLEGHKAIDHREELGCVTLRQISLYEVGVFDEEAWVDHVRRSSGGTGP